MMRHVRTLGGLLAIVACLLLGAVPPSAEAPSQLPLTSIAATGGQELRVWDGAVERMIREGSLRFRKSQEDPMLPGRRSERYDQYFSGVRIWGADVVRVTADDVTVTVFGMIAGAIPIGVEPKLVDEGVSAAFSAIAGTEGRVLSPPELVILPTENGAYRLTYQAVVSSGATVERVFIDASTGSAVLRISEIKTQTPAVGKGTGVLGDQKKISVTKTSSTYIASDELRPPTLQTFDMGYSLTKALGVIYYDWPLYQSDFASDSDNNWTDAAVVDAHVHLARTYDYYFKRFGRNGFDDHGHPLVGIVNAVSQQGALTMPASMFGTFAVNAFFCGTCGPDGSGVMFFGNGIPPGYYMISTGQNVTYLAGGLDIVAHELTHGVTQHSSQLVYRDESGALSETFSDVMGTSVEFYYQPVGNTGGKPTT